MFELGLSVIILQDFFHEFNNIMNSFYMLSFDKKYPEKILTLRVILLKPQGIKDSQR